MSSQRHHHAGRASASARLLEGALGVAAGGFLLAMMLITTVDVAGRYLLASPLPGAFELTQVLLAATIFAGLPLVTLRESHVSVTLLSGRLKGRAAELHAALSTLLSLVAFAVIARQLAVQAMRLASYGDTTSLLRIPMAPLAWGMAGMAGVSVVVLALLCAAHLLAAARQPAPRDGASA